MRDVLACAWCGRPREHRAHDLSPRFFTAEEWAAAKRDLAHAYRGPTISELEEEVKRLRGALEERCSTPG